MPRPSVTIFALAALVAATPAWGQNSGRGFLLATPMGSVSLRAGYDQATAGSDIFSFAQDQLTLSKKDFGSPAIAADVGIRLSDRFDFVVGSAYSGSTTKSEYRDFIDNNDLPIEQTTTFRRVPIAASLKAYLASRGQSVGQFAWIPSKVAPYVGAGAGAIWYQFKQSGDFVDFDTQSLNVFTQTYESSSWSTEAHAFAGVDYSLSPRVALTGEARYTWGRANMDAQTFSGFHRIDLSGVGMTAGLTVRF